MSLLVIIFTFLIFTTEPHSLRLSWSPQPSPITGCVTRTLCAPLLLRVLCCWTIRSSSTHPCPSKPALPEVAHVNFAGFPANAWELTHLSSWMPTSLRQERVFKHRVRDEHTAVCLYSYRHACLSDTDNWIFIHIFAWEIRRTVYRGRALAFQGLA